MKSIYFLQPLYFLCKKNLEPYFTKKYIIKGFFIAFLISNFIFFAIFDNKIINYIASLIALIGIYNLLISDKKVCFWIGFFVGILWFYWISFSLIYYGFWFLIPFEILAIGIIYGLIFLVFLWFSNQLLRLILVVLLGYFYPFNFNWLNFELIFVNTPFAANSITLFSFLASFIIIKKHKIIGILILALSIYYNLDNTQKHKIDDLNFEIVQTKINQKNKWDRRFLSIQISENLEYIKKAIENKKTTIILPETAFPMFLDRDESLIKYLKELSKNITIITGGLSHKNQKTYNSIFVFQNQELQIFDKFILVPFGEEVPLPNFLKNLINNTFFKGNSDFGKGETYGEISIEKNRFRLAICYEATRKELYENSPKFLIAISNNGWFIPSTEPILQKIIIKYYARKNKTTIFHSVNGSKSEIIF